MTRTTRRLALALAACTALTPALSFAQPAKVVRFIVPFPAGGTADVLPRVLAESIRPAFPNGIVVENKSGAGGNIGAAEVARADADGTTYLVSPPGPIAGHGPASISLPWSRSSVSRARCAGRADCRRANTSGPSWPSITYHMPAQFPYPKPESVARARIGPPRAAPHDADRWTRSARARTLATNYLRPEAAAVATGLPHRRHTHIDVRRCTHPVRARNPLRLHRPAVRVRRPESIRGQRGQIFESAYFRCP